MVPACLKWQNDQPASPGSSAPFESSGPTPHTFRRIAVSAHIRLRPGSLPKVLYRVKVALVESYRCRSTSLPPNSPPLLSAARCHAWRQTFYEMRQHLVNHFWRKASCVLLLRRSEASAAHLSFKFFLRARALSIATTPWPIPRVTPINGQSHTQQEKWTIQPKGNSPSCIP